MERSTLLKFQLTVMDIVEAEDCRTAQEYGAISEKLHEALESAIMDMCMDAGIEYDPVY